MPVFTRASSVFIPAVPAHILRHAVLFMTTRNASIVYLSSLTGMRRLAFALAEAVLPRNCRPGPVRTFLLRRVQRSHRMKPDCLLMWSFVWQVGIADS
jgi:hypothetical protein